MDTEDVPQVLSSSTLTEETVEAVEDKEVESKESCHDSGIDIRKLVFHQFNQYKIKR